MKLGIGLLRNLIGFGDRLASRYYNSLVRHDDAVTTAEVDWAPDSIGYLLVIKDERTEEQKTEDAFFGERASLIPKSYEEGLALTQTLPHAKQT